MVNATFAATAATGAAAAAVKATLTVTVTAQATAQAAVTATAQCKPQVEPQMATVTVSDSATMRTVFALCASPPQSDRHSARQNQSIYRLSVTARGDTTSNEWIDIEDPK